MNLNRILLLNLRTTLVAVVICMISGLIISIPTNYAIDAEATRFVWSGGMISGPERVEQHRQRTTCSAILGAIVGLLPHSRHFGHARFKACTEMMLHQNHCRRRTSRGMQRPNPKTIKLSPPPVFPVVLSFPREVTVVPNAAGHTRIVKHRITNASTRVANRAEFEINVAGGNPVMLDVELNRFAACRLLTAPA